MFGANAMQLMFIFGTFIVILVALIKNQQFMASLEPSIRSGNKKVTPSSTLMLTNDEEKQLITQIGGLIKTAKAFAQDPATLSEKCHPVNLIVEKWNDVPKNQK